MGDASSYSSFALRETSRLTWLYVALFAFVTAAASYFASAPELREPFVGAALGSSVLLVLVWRRRDLSLGVVVGLALVFRMLFIWLLPSLSDDAFRYVWDGMIQSEGVNPFLLQPEDATLSRLHDEAIFSELNSGTFHSVYPPASQLVFFVGGLFYDFGWQVSYYVIKLILAGAEFAAVLLLARILDARAVLLYAWNPLVLIESAGQAHTEAAAVFLVILAWHLARTGRGGWAGAALACAGWIKLYPFFLLPFLWRRCGWRSIWASIGTALALAAPYAHPSVPQNVLSSLDLYVRYFEFNAGPYYAVKKVFMWWTGEDWSKQLGPFFRALFLALMPVFYLADWKARWPLARAFVVTIGAFLVLSTTVHPWYIVPVLALTAAAGKPAWHWYWLGGLSLGTYLLYTGGPYWIWVVLGWSGWFVLAGVAYRSTAADLLVRFRARKKASLAASWLPEPSSGLRVLDLGAGEGYVGRHLQRGTGAHVTLADVRPANRTDLPFIVYDGERLPFSDGAFDVTLIYFVLHHCRDPVTVLREAARVTRRRILIAESTYRHAWELRVLEVLDRTANRLRSAGTMSAQEAFLNFRAMAGWRSLLESLGLSIEHEEDYGGFVHRPVLFVIDLEAQDGTGAERKLQDASLAS